MKTCIFLLFSVLISILSADALKALPILQTNQLISDGGFESGRFFNWGAEIEGKGEIDVVSMQTPHGISKVCRFSSSAADTDRGRTELLFGARQDQSKILIGSSTDGLEGTDLWYSWDFMVPQLATVAEYKSETTSNWALGQFHSNDPNVTCASPEVGMKINNGNNLVLWGKQRLSADGDACISVNWNFDGYQVASGKWYRIVIHALWSRSPENGFVEGKVYDYSISQWHAFSYTENGSAYYKKQVRTNNDGLAFNAQADFKIGTYHSKGLNMYFEDYLLGPYIVFFDNIQAVKKESQLIAP